jgi:inosose dehydratase
LIHGIPVADPSPANLDEGRRLRMALQVGGDLDGVLVGAVPLLWTYADRGATTTLPSPAAILDDIVRTGYDGLQLGAGFPEGDELRSALDQRDLRLAEVYAWIPATPDGPTASALDIVRERLRLLVAGRGEVLCIAFDGAPDRDPHAGRADDPATPRLTRAGWAATAVLLRTIAEETRAAGARIAFHPHAATYIETPDEVDRLATLVDPDLLPFCLDVGHWIVGGGDPLEALRRFGDRIGHVHLKDVDGGVLAALRAGRIGGLDAAVRARLFTELGAGVLDLDAVVRILAERQYAGWVMVEQDTSWPPPAESAAIGRRVLAAAMRRAVRREG